VSTHTLVACVVKPSAREENRIGTIENGAPNASWVTAAPAVTITIQRRRPIRAVTHGVTAAPVTRPMPAAATA